MATACNCNKPLLVVFLIVAGAVVMAESSTDANLTLVNDCEYPVWPKIIPNDGYSPISSNTARLDTKGAASYRIPGGAGAAWTGQVMARTGCAVETPDEGPSQCASGEALPATVVQVQAHAYGRADMAVYSVSLSGGFNVPATVTPHAFPRGSVCPVLGCTVDLNPSCPQARRVVAGGAVVACRSDAAAGGYFKQRCPKTLTWSGDSVDVDQRCVAPAELKVIFCPTTMVTTAGADQDGGDDEPGLIRGAFAAA